jgi:hypothetical protein
VYGRLPGESLQAMRTEIELEKEKRKGPGLVPGLFHVLQHQFFDVCLD